MSFYHGIDLPLDAKRVLNRIGNAKIHLITVVRKPLGKYTRALLNLASSGSFEKKFNEIPADDLYHLFMILHTSKGKYSLEKNELISLKKSGNTRGGQSHDIPLSQEIDVDTLIGKTKSFMGDKFTTYQASHNNCSNFVYDVLQANHLATPELKSFILQDTKHLFEGNETFRKTVNTITDVGALGHRLATSTAENIPFSKPLNNLGLIPFQ